MQKLTHTVRYKALKNLDMLGVSALISPLTECNSVLMYVYLLSPWAAMYPVTDKTQTQPATLDNIHKQTKCENFAMFYTLKPHLYPIIDNPSRLQVTRGSSQTQGAGLPGEAHFVHRDEVV